MSWLRIDDTFYDHPKIVAAGPLAVALHVFGMTYASRHGTDGFVPSSMLPWLVRFDGIQLTLGLEPRGPAMPVDVQAIAARLVEIGLWHPAAAPCARCKLRRGDRRPGERDGYLVHDFLEFNPSGAEAVERREQRSAAGRIGGLRSGETRRNAAARSRTEAGASRLLEPRPGPSPSPVPNYVGTATRSAGVDLTSAQEAKAILNAVVDEWRKLRTGAGLERFTDPQAIAGLKTRTKSALGAGVTFEDLRVAIVRHAHDPKANPWYIDEWAREVRAEREEAEHVARKAQERRELDAMADRERGLRPLGAILEDARRRSADG